MKIHVSAVFRVIDCYRKLPVNKQGIYFHINGNKVVPTYKEGGYFVFTNLREGQYKFLISSYFYQSQEIECLIEEHADYKMHYVFLMPSKQSLLSNEDTIIPIECLDKEENLLGQKIYIAYEEKEYFKIAQEYVEAGEEKVKLFFSQGMGKKAIIGKYLIKDKDSCKNEICTVLREEGEKDVYKLENKLKYSHARSTPLIEVMENEIDCNGRSYMIIKDYKAKKDSNIRVLMQEQDGLKEIYIQMLE